MPGHTGDMWFLLACGDARGPRDPSDTVEYSGYVLSGPTDTETLLTDGTATFTPDEGEAVEAEQPYEDYPGYWSAELPTGTPFTLRLAGSGAYPSVWRGRAPGADGTWFSGALFGAERTQVDTFLAGLDVPLGSSPAALGEGEVAHLWGYPWSAEGWDCALLTVNGEPALCYFQDPDTGSLTRVQQGAFTWFVALNLEPGGVVVDSGVGGAETYQVAGGDMVYAFWLTATDDAQTTG